MHLALKKYGRVGFIKPFGGGTVKFCGRVDKGVAADRKKSISAELYQTINKDVPKTIAEDQEKLDLNTLAGRKVARL